MKRSILLFTALLLLMTQADAQTQPSGDQSLLKVINEVGYAK